MNFTEYLIKQQPICTTSPLRGRIKPEEYYKLRAKCIKDYGQNLLDDGCANAFNCITTGECIGRPLPDYPEVRSALKHLDMTEGEYKGKPVIYLKVHVKCDTCPFRSNCTEVCGALNDHFNRRDPLKEPIYDSNTDSLSDVTANYLDKLSYDMYCSPTESPNIVQGVRWTTEDMAWDALSDQQRTALEYRFMDGLEQAEIAERMGLNQKTVHEYLESGLARMRKFTQARLAIKAEPKTHWVIKAYFVHNKTQAQIAKKAKKSQQWVNKVMTQWVMVMGIK